MIHSRYSVLFPCQRSELWQHKLPHEHSIIPSPAQTLGLAQGSSLTLPSREHTHTQSAASAQPGVEKRTWNILIRMVEFWGETVLEGQTNSWHGMQSFFPFITNSAIRTWQGNQAEAHCTAFENTPTRVLDWDYSLISCKTHSQLALNFQDFWKLGLVGFGLGIFVIVVF